MKRIILTGGGTAGHVTPNIALLPKLKELGYDIHYIGSYNGIEKELIEPFNIPYYGISSGKLRRYFSWQNRMSFSPKVDLYLFLSLWLVNATKFRLSFMNLI